MSDTQDSAAIKTFVVWPRGNSEKAEFINSTSEESAIQHAYAYFGPRWGHTSEFGIVEAGERDDDSKIAAKMIDHPKYFSATKRLHVERVT